jgi:hypothetical protein
MSVPTLDGPEKGGDPMLGPVSSVMGAIFDSVSDETPETPADEGAETPPETGAEPDEAGGDTGEPEVPGTPAEGTGEAEGEPAADEAPVRSAPPVVTVDDQAVVERFNEISEALDERFTESFEQQAVEQAQEDYPQYIEMLQMHPLELVGKDLPSIDGSDDPIVLRSAAEVEQWQGAVKTILQRELEDIVQQKQQESNEVLDVVHASIELFKDNPDLYPGSKSYNKEMASQFIKLAEPYALKMNGKLTGWSIPVQGLVDQVRAQVKAKQPAGTPPAKKAAPAHKPQGGIPSKAGESGAGEVDYSPMWGALGIKNVPI